MGTKADDISRGKEAVRYFHNRALFYDGYDLSFDDSCIAIAHGKDPQYFLEAFGLIIENLLLDGTITQSKIRNAMEKLADDGGGRIPSNQQAFFSALSNSATNFSWIEATKYTASQTASTVVQGTQQIGNAVIASGSGLLSILPLLAIGGVVAFIYFKVVPSGRGIKI